MYDDDDDVVAHTDTLFQLLCYDDDHDAHTVTHPHFHTFPTPAHDDDPQLCVTGGVACAGRGTAAPGLPLLYRGQGQAHDHDQRRRISVNAGRMRSDAGSHLV